MLEVHPYLSHAGPRLQQGCMTRGKMCTRVRGGSSSLSGSLKLLITYSQEHLMTISMLQMFQWLQTRIMLPEDPHPG